MAQVLYDELNVAAVAITDTEKLLAFIGVGRITICRGTPIALALSPRQPLPIMKWSMPTAAKRRTAVRSTAPKLGSTLVIPADRENKQVVGTIKLWYEVKNRLFSSINRTGRRDCQPVVGSDSGGQF